MELSCYLGHIQSLLNIEVSSFYGVGIKVISGSCWNGGGPLLEVSSFYGVGIDVYKGHFRELLEWRWSTVRGVLILRNWNGIEVSHFRGLD